MRQGQVWKFQHDHPPKETDEVTLNLLHRPDLHLIKIQSSDHPEHGAALAGPAQVPLFAALATLRVWPARVT